MFCKANRKLLVQRRYSIALVKISCSQQHVLTVGFVLVLSKNGTTVVIHKHVVVSAKGYPEVLLRKHSGPMSCRRNRFAIICNVRFCRAATAVSAPSSYRVHKFIATRSVR